MLPIVDMRERRRWPKSVVNNGRLTQWDSRMVPIWHMMPTAATTRREHEQIRNQTVSSAAWEPCAEDVGRREGRAGCAAKDRWPLRRSHIQMPDDMGAG